MTPRSWGGRLFGRVPPTGLVLLGILSVQLGSALAKGLFDAVGSFGTVTLRLFFAAVVLLLVWRPPLRMTRRAWGSVIVYGAVLALMNLLSYLSLARIPLGIAVSIELLGPLAVALAGSRRWRDAAWALLATAGVVLLMDGGGDLDLLGGRSPSAPGCGPVHPCQCRARPPHHRGQRPRAGTAVAAIIAAPVGIAESGAALVHPGVLVGGWAWRCCHPSSPTRSISRPCAGCRRGCSGSS